MDDRRKRAVEAIADFLVSAGATPYAGATDAWQVTLTVEGGHHEVLLRLPADVPFVRPLIYAAGSEEAAQKLCLHVPHTNWDGTLCVLPNEATVDPDDPVGVTKATLEAAAALLTDWRLGRRQEEFHDEINAFWSPLALGRYYVDVPPDYTGPTVYYWKDNAAGVYLSSDEGRLARIAFLRSRATIKPPFEQGLLLRLQGLVLPKDYPSDGVGFRTLVKSHGGDYSHVLGRLRAKRPFPVVLGLESRSEAAQQGPIYVGAFITPRESKAGASQFFRAKSTSAGFRQGHLPPEIVEGQLLRHEITRIPAERIDSQWLHFRGGAGRLADDLFKKKVCVIGCGALGSGLVGLLLREGVKHFTLIDGQKLRWENLGRHQLGALYVNQGKASGLSVWARTESFDVEAVHRETNWQAVFAEDPRFFDQFDLVISATGEWSANTQLNLALFGKRPLQFLWTEPFAAAGHSLITTGMGGCLGCGFDRTGVFRKQVFDWPKGSMVKLPGCGGSFQPYGLGDAASISAMAARHSLEFLRGPSDRAELRTWICAPAAADGVVQPGWKDIISNLPFGVGEFRQPWPHDETCGICR